MTYFPLYQTTCFFIPLVAPCKPLLSKVDENMLYYAANTTDRFDEPITTFFEIYPEGKIMVMLVSGGLPSEYED